MAGGRGPEHGDRRARLRGLGSRPARGRDGAERLAHGAGGRAPDLRRRRSRSAGTRPAGCSASNLLPSELRRRSCLTARRDPRPPQLDPRLRFRRPPHRRRGRRHAARAPRRPCGVAAGARHAGLGGGRRAASGSGARPRLVVGLPYNMDGSETAADGRLPRVRGASCRSGTQLPVDLVDERLTSSAAEADLRDARRSGARERRIDARTSTRTRRG